MSLFMPETRSSVLPAFSHHHCKQAGWGWGICQPRWWGGVDIVDKVGRGSNWWLRRWGGLENWSQEIYGMTGVSNLDEFSEKLQRSDRKSTAASGDFFTVNILGGPPLWLLPGPRWGWEGGRAWGSMRRIVLSQSFEERGKRKWNLC